MPDVDDENKDWPSEQKEDFGGNIKLNGLSYVFQTENHFEFSELCNFKREDKLLLLIYSHLKFEYRYICACVITVVELGILTRGRISL